VVGLDGVQETLTGIDTIVLAVGTESVDELAEAMRGIVSEVHVIGNARSPGTAMDAIAAGAEVGRAI
jgi:hypothetical protein